MPDKRFYAVRSGKTPGVFTKKKSLTNSVGGASERDYRSFANFDDAQAYVNGEVDVPHETVYICGMGRGNSKRGTVGGVGVWYGPKDDRNLSRPIFGRPPAKDKGPGPPPNVRQRAELTAIIRMLEAALKRCLSHRYKTKGIRIAVESEPTILALTEWGERWERNNYQHDKRPIDNVDLIIQARELIKVYNAVFKVCRSNCAADGILFRRPETQNEGTKGAYQLGFDGAGLADAPPAPGPRKGGPSFNKGTGSGSVGPPPKSFGRPQGSPRGGMRGGASQRGGRARGGGSTRPPMARR